MIFSLSVGTVLEASIGQYKGKQTGENSLFRKLHDTLTEGDIIVADRYFSGWSDLALPLRAASTWWSASINSVARISARASDWAKTII